jgi:hypothetical protein
VNEVLTPGHYTRTFEGSKLASGIYLARLQTGTILLVKKLLLVK